MDPTSPSLQRCETSYGSSPNSHPAIVPSRYMTVEISAVITFLT
jgi:hypothetical protein